MVRVSPPAVAAPPRHDLDSAREVAPVPETAIDLSAEGAVARGVAEAVVIDTRRAQPQIQLPAPGSTSPRAVKEILPRHQRRETVLPGQRNALAVGTLLDEARAMPAAASWPAIGATAWTPPDPTLAVGPTHVVTTVNMALAFYSRDGVVEYSNDLSNAGNPGFFEPVGAGGFTFDPKCFYDHYAQRFVVLALEVYEETQEAYITIAVSDDSNPHGIWYKYRTDAVISVGFTTYWWDYPGAGYDDQGYYVTGNLFGLNQGGWAGVGFRVFDKSSMLDGSPVIYATLRDGNAASVQVAQQFGASPAPFFVSVESFSSVRIQAIRDPLTAPTLATTIVTVPSFNSPSGAPSQGADDVDLIDTRILNVNWRDGNLYAAHSISSGGRNFARWYHLDTGNWPDSGSVAFVQAGEIDAGGDLHSWFPAIYSNRFHDVALVCGTSSSSSRIRVNATGREVADPLGTMGALTELKLAPVNGGGRWGDYYDVAIDPLDDTTFWVIGEYPESFGWANWIASYRITAIDMSFFNATAACMQGPDVPYPSGCEKSDLSLDNDVDLHDMYEIQQIFDT